MQRHHLEHAQLSNTGPLVSMTKVISAPNDSQPFKTWQQHRPCLLRTSRATCYLLNRCPILKTCTHWCPAAKPVTNSMFHFCILMADAFAASVTAGHVSARLITCASCMAVCTIKAVFKAVLSILKQFCVHAGVSQACKMMM